jgi:alkylmercury lyase
MARMLVARARVHIGCAGGSRRRDGRCAGGGSEEARIVRSADADGRPPGSIGGEAVLLERWQTYWSWLFYGLLVVSTGVAVAEVDGDRRRVAVVVLAAGLAVWYRQAVAGGARPARGTGSSALLSLAVGAARLAERVDWSEEQVSEELARWPGVYRDEAGRVIGYAGLTVVEMGAHRLHVDGRDLSTWCAYDTLFLPELLGATVRVTSRCPVTDRRISLTVGPESVGELEPPDAVVSLLVPDRPFGDDVIRSFCHFVHFFASPEAAERWTAEHEGTFAIPVADAFKVGRMLNQARVGAALAR